LENLSGNPDAFIPVGVCARKIRKSFLHVRSLISVSFAIMITCLFLVSYRQSSMEICVRIIQMADGARKQNIPVEPLCLDYADETNSDWPHFMQGSNILM
jgi:hypothetical protein